LFADAGHAGARTVFISNVPALADRAMSFAGVLRHHLKGAHMQLVVSSFASCLALLAACGDNGLPAPDAGAPSTFAARIRGPLAAKVTDSKAYHDQVAMQGEAQAHAAGDFAHHVGLGTADLGTTPDEFLAIDQWHDAATAAAFYADPNFQAAFSKLFAAAPQVQLFERHPDWASWGEMGSGRLSARPYWMVTVQGRLAQPALADNHAHHDTIASAGETMARAAGDLAHLPHLNPADDREFFNVDIWSNEQNMLATFTDPNFRAAFLSLFESPPDLRIYASTDWYQWYMP
jgi:quinol monooxygenase YgiN